MEILITAPYMIQEREKVEVMFDSEINGSCTVDWAEVDERLSESELLEIIDDYDGVICGDDRFTPKVLDTANDLKVIVKWGTGIDSIDVEAARDRDIPVYNTEDAFTVPVADTTLGFMLSLVRNVVQSDRLMKDGKWEKPLGITLSELTVGIIGMGHIGKAVVRRLQGFDAELLGNDIREISEEFVEQHEVEMVEKDRLFRQSDIISLHCDLNDRSHHVIDETAIQSMEQSPWVVNTARGPLINQDDLVEALENQRLLGAGLDVFEQEPLPENHPLRSMDNVLLSSHNANSSSHYWEQVHENSIRMLKKGLNLE